jgi:hypothetical protein
MNSNSFPNTSSGLVLINLTRSWFVVNESIVNIRICKNNIELTCIKRKMTLAQQLCNSCATVGVDPMCWIPPHESHVGLISCLYSGAQQLCTNHSLYQNVYNSHVHFKISYIYVFLNLLKISRKAFFFFFFIRPNKQSINDLSFVFDMSNKLNKI